MTSYAATTACPVAARWPVRLSFSYAVRGCAADAASHSTALSAPATVTVCGRSASTVRAP